MNYKLKIQEKYFQLIKQGTKIYEGRLGNKQTEIYPGLLIDFISINIDTLTRKRLTRKVVSVELFPDFEAMLKDRVKDFLPDCPSLEEGVATYHAIPGYQEKVSKFGALAIQLEKLEEPKFSFLGFISLSAFIIILLFYLYFTKKKNNKND